MDAELVFAPAEDPELDALTYDIELRQLHGRATLEEPSAQDRRVRRVEAREHLEDRSGQL